MYDLCIVGAGLIGSAAARHAASSQPKVKVALVGPEEPKDKRDQNILGAWFDEGRITREASTNPVWAKLAIDSIARYRQIERESGIHFYHEIGSLITGEAGTEYISCSKASVAKYGIKATFLNSSQLRESFPYINFADNSEGVAEKKSAGYINPRKLRQAELLLAIRHGCDVIDDVVKNISEIQHGGQTVFELTSEGGRKLLAEKVLLCTGVFTAFRKLLPVGLIPDIELLSQVVILAEVDEADQQKLRQMPCVIYDGLRIPQPAEIATAHLYALPPIKYPDGKYYVKVGHGPEYERPLVNEQEVAAWYTQPVLAREHQGLKSFLNALLQDIHPKSYHMDTCVTTRTHNRQPYIDLLTPNLGVVIGGNGVAAKSCDQLGKLGADLVLKGHWSFPFPREQFRCKWKGQQAKL